MIFIKMWSFSTLLLGALGELYLTGFYLMKSHFIWLINFVTETIFNELNQGHDGHKSETDQ